MIRSLDDTPACPAPAYRQAGSVGTGPVGRDFKKCLNRFSF